jgi:invasion protein IalB
MSNTKRILVAGAVAAVTLAGGAYLARDHWLPWVGFGSQDVAKGATPVAAGGTGPVRTETTTFDNWTLTCRAPVDGSAPKSCYGDLKLIDKERKTTMLSWIVGRSAQGALVSVLQTPTGVNIGQGVQFSFAGRKVRTLPYQLCEPQRCEATLEMDASLLDEARKATEATVVITATDGRKINFTVPVKGLTNVLAATGR